jgi:hypothetical protein
VGIFLLSIRAGRAAMMNELCAEPSLDEVLKDAATRMLMRSDGVSESDIRGLLRRVAGALSLRGRQSAAARSARRRLSPTWLAGFATAAILGVPATYEAFQSPAGAIRSALTATAVEIASPVGSRPTEAQLASIHRYFPLDAAIDADAWPQLAVTLHHLSQGTCEQVLGSTQRLEGLVVVELEHYRASADCVVDNDMTWRITP